MGCTSSKPLNSNKRKKKQNETETHQLNSGEEEYTQIKPVENVGSVAVSPKSNNAENLVLLEGAPKSFSLYPGSKNNMNKFKSKNPKEIILNEKSIRNLNGLPEIVEKYETKQQPVDQNARQLALSNKRPSCWKDFYWHLIESRGLRDEEEKVRAIFSWVCSLNHFEKPDDSELKEKKFGSKTPSESPIAVIEAFRLDKISHNQAFEIVCTACGIESVIIEGIAKGSNFNVNDRELIENIEETGQPLFNEEENKIHPLAKMHFHSWNACKINDKWELFDPIWAARRLTIQNDKDENDANEGKSNRQTFKEALLLQYETDMFYFKTDPKKLLFTHFPFDAKWQLIDPQMSLRQFHEKIILKPIFFRYGLGVYSHKEANIITKSELVIKFLLPDKNYEDLKFTFNLTREGLGDIHKSQNLFPFGMHWISEKERNVTFRFRFPKSGRYRLILYVRNKDEKLFADICEYSILANLSETESIYPFPHDSQTSYGPTEIAKELNVIVTPVRTETLLKSINGMIEIKFRNSINGNKNLPKITARLKSVLTKTDNLQDCLLFRNIEACQARTGMSDYLQINPKNPIFGCGSCIPLSVVTVYIPEPGEYALEVFAKPADAPDEDSYKLVWQFLINSELGWPMNDYLRSQLNCINMGPQNHLWEKLGMATLSHVDPLIRIPTHGRLKEGVSENSKRSQKSLLNRYASESSTINSSYFGQESSTASQITVMDANQLESMKNELGNDALNPKITLDGIDENLNRNSFDLKIVITGPPRNVLTVIAQLVDISEDEEKDLTSFIHRLSDEESNNEEDLLEDLIQNELNSSDHERNSEVNESKNSNRISYHIRIPTGGHFYKFYLYASPTNMDITESIPLIFTYLIEAPIRITSAEQPYVGAILGPYEKYKESTEKI